MFISVQTELAELGLAVCCELAVLEVRGECGKVQNSQLLLFFFFQSPCTHRRFFRGVGGIDATMQSSDSMNFVTRNSIAIRDGM